MFSQLLRKRFYCTRNLPNIKFTEKGSCGIVQLDRPKALNAISGEMFVALYQLMRDLQNKKSHVIMKGGEKIFSAGGDVKQLSKAYKEPGYDYPHFIYSLGGYRLIHNYKIPYIPLINGVALGGSVALGAAAKNFRVVTENTRFAMPETMIAFYNDAGASYFLSRLKNNVGFYMSLASARITGSDMIKLGLADYYVESERLEELENALVECKSAEEIKKVLKKFSTEPKEKSELDEVLSRVDKCFDGDTVEEIIDNLHLDGSDWAMRTVKILNTLSPTSLKVCHRELKLGKHLTLEECLKMEYRMVNHFFAKSDFDEGIRALLVDKDNKPRFNPKTLHEVTQEDIERFFKPLPDDKEFKAENY